MIIIEQYIEQENGEDKIYYDKWKKTNFKKQITKGYDERHEFDTDEDYKMFKDCLITRTINVYDKTDEDLEKEDLKDEKVMKFIKDNENIKVLHINEYNKLIKRIKELEEKVDLQNKKLIELTDFKDNHICISNEDNTSDGENKNDDLKQKSLHTIKNVINHFKDESIIKKDKTEDITLEDKTLEDKSLNDYQINQNKDLVDKIPKSSQNKSESNNDLSENKKKKLRKNKESNDVLKSIKKNYNKIKVKIDENDKYGSNKLKNSIIENENIINIKKVNHIYLYKNYYKKYLSEKEKNKDLKLKDFVGNDFDEETRIYEKLKICYTFINEFKKNIKDILIKCKISISKLYKIRNEDFDELINFINEKINCSEN